MKMVKKYLKEIYISLEERQKFVDDLKLMEQFNNGISKNNKLLDNTPNQPSKFKTKKLGRNK